MVVMPQFSKNFSAWTLEVCKLWLSLSWNQCHIKARALRAPAQGPSFKMGPQIQASVNILSIKVQIIWNVCFIAVLRRLGALGKTLIWGPYKYISFGNLCYYLIY